MTNIFFGGNGDDKIIAGFSNMFAEGGGGEGAYIYTLGSGHLDIKEVRNGEEDTLWLRNNFSQDWFLGYENFYLYQYETGENILEIVHNERMLAAISHLDVVDENGHVEYFGYDTEIQDGMAPWKYQ